MRSEARRPGFWRRPLRALSSRLRDRVVVGVGAGLLLAVVVLVGVVNEGNPSDILTGALAVLALALVADNRIAQRRFGAALRAGARKEARDLRKEARDLRRDVRDLRRELRNLRKEVGSLRASDTRNWQTVYWTRRNTQKLRDELAVVGKSNRRLERAVVSVADESTQRIERAVVQLGKTSGYQYRERIVDWRQVESLQNLYALLPPRQAVPGLRGWAASPDLLMWIVGHVLERRPRTVLECGSGASTLWTAYAMERIGGGRVISLEHDPFYAERTRALLARHELSAYVEVRTAPLTPVRVGDQEWLWYDTAALADLPPVDLLVVDGPPADTGSLARYPAGPLVVGYLAPDGVVVLDDAVRADERKIARRWAEELGFDVEHIKDMEKQALVLRRPAAPAAGAGAGAELAP